MLISDDLNTDVVLIDGASVRLTGAELSRLRELRQALARFDETCDPAQLQRGLVAARGLVPELTGAQEGMRPDLAQLRGLAESVPELGELLTVAAEQTEHVVAAGYDRLWMTFGLTAPAPRWSAAELGTARMVFACACGPAAAETGDWLQASLRRVAAPRVAVLICEDLCRRESVWLATLDDRYGSLRHRCAPRTARGSRGLAELLAEDEACRQAVTGRLERWVAAGAHPHELSAELEAAVVHARTPSRLA